MDNTPGDKLGVWRDMLLADALVIIIITVVHYFQTSFVANKKKQHEGKINQKSGLGL